MTVIDISDNEILYTTILKHADAILQWRKELHQKYGIGPHTIGYRLDYAKDRDFGFHTSGGSTPFSHKKLKHEIITSFTHWLKHARATDADYIHVEEYKNAFTATTICNLLK